MLQRFRGSKITIFTGFCFLVLSLIHIPNQIFPHIFDKNAAPQFFTLTVISALMGIYITWRSEKFRTTRLVRGAILFTIAIVSVSALLSGNIISAITGDTGRYAGVASLCALILVSIFHSQFSLEQIHKLIRLYTVAAFLVVLIGLMQHFSLISLPGDAGVTSTLGNQDFFAAYVGVCMPLYFYISLKSSRRSKAILACGFLISVYVLYLATPLQSYVDIALTISGIALYKLRTRLPRKSLSLNARTFLGTTLIIIWAEFIFLMPFLGSWIPVLGNDTQVKIRANFWLAGTREFFSHPLVGVGPDQYGSFYEKYRTLSDVRNFEKILANDAHSASVQTLATLGIAGTLAFVVLLAFLVRSLLLLWDSRSIDRQWIYALGLFFFVYLTNSFISPITLPSKFLFWGLAGWVIGNAYRSHAPAGYSLRLPVIALSLSVALVGCNFGIAQWNYSTAFEKYAKNQKTQAHYAFNPFLPCFMYFEGQFHIMENNSLEEIGGLARDQVNSNPRCVSGHIILAQIYQGTKDMPNLKNQIDQLISIAPTRTEVLRMAIEYANKVGDINLYNQLQRKLSELGFVYVPGKNG